MVALLTAPALVFGEEPAAESAKDAAAGLKLPGLTINLEEKSVDVEATVCLESGFLELVACTKDSKEHESIISVKAKAAHVHAALLLLGTAKGNPAMRKPINEEMTRWLDLPPRGGEVAVSLLVLGLTLHLRRRRTVALTAGPNREVPAGGVSPREV